MREIIGEELERFQTDRAAREVAPLVTELRARAEQIRVGELARFRAKLDGLDRRTRRGRGAHAGHREQAAARADRAAEGRGRHRRAASCTPTRSRRSSTFDVRDADWNDRAIRVATRGSALARWQAERVVARLGGRPSS